MVGSPTHHSMKLRGRHSHGEKLRHYTRGGDVKVKISPHRKAHAKKNGGTVAYARGGGVMGGEAKSRLDKPRSKSSKGGNKGTHVNIVVAHPQAPARPIPVPVPSRVPPPGGAPMPPQAPTAGAPPPVAGMGGLGGMGNVARPIGPPVGAGLRKHGGRLTYAKGGHVKIDDGAGGGEGRLEKIKAYGKNADIKEPGKKGLGEED